MKIIRGPFAVDPNISNICFHFDGTLWCILRRSLNNVAGTDFGIIKFSDVRTFRSRPRVVGQNPDITPAELPPDCWLTEEENSPFLEQARGNDPQRAPVALRAHRHFVVIDGHHVAIDVVARSFTLLERDQMNIDVRALIENDEYEL